LLIIDEGLDNLPADYYSKMLPILFGKKAKGMSILLITHKIDDIYDVADRVSIMRNGRILATDEVRRIDKMTLLRMTYTQMTKSAKPIRDAREFHNFLKYNEAILQFLPVSLIVTDQQNRITLVNDYCKQYFNLTDQYFDAPLEMLFQERNRDVFELLLKAFASDEGKTFYHLTLVFDPRTTMTNIKTLPIKDGSFVIGNIVLIEDVTEFERMQQRLILSEKLASVGLLAAGVAHEINNPLEIIQNYLAFIRYNFSNERLLSVVDTIQNEIVNISGIVSNLVSFSDKRSTDFEIVDVNEVITEIIGLLKYNAEYKCIEVEFKPKEKSLRLSVNRNELKQVILNLIKNSFEAMPDGGSININTFTTVEDGQMKTRIMVSDTGPGIAEEDIKNIFLPFFSTKKGKENNLGLGLSVSYAIIQHYGGSITAMNNEDCGSRFTISLPTPVGY
jgi:two-component system sensor histidine kinase AtoS